MFQSKVLPGMTLEVINPTRNKGLGIYINAAVQQL